MVVELVGKDDLTSAIALNSAVFNAARMVGPAVGGLLIARYGVALAFFPNGVRFLAALADKAGQLPVPQNPTLKTPDRFKLIGKRVPRLDTPDKVTGRAIYGIDVSVSGMRRA